MTYILLQQGHWHRLAGYAAPKLAEQIVAYVRLYDEKVQPSLSSETANLPKPSLTKQPATALYDNAFPTSWFKLTKTSFAREIVTSADCGATKMRYFSSFVSDLSCDLCTDIERLWHATSRCAIWMLPCLSPRSISAPASHSMRVQSAFPTAAVKCNPLHLSVTKACERNRANAPLK